MDSLFFVVLYIGAGLLILLITVLTWKYNAFRREEMPYKSACAGSPHDYPQEKVSKSVHVNTFLDNDGKPIDVDKYDWFIACGESMHLSGINDGDIIFTEKGYVFNKNEEFPSVFILNRDEEKEKAQFKIRRGWKVVDFVDENDMMNKLESIMDSAKFKEIIIDKNSEFYPGNDEVKKDFSERCLPDYIKKYQPAERACNREIMISTTLHTDDNKIYFSIHPINLIRGRVLYSFTVITFQSVS